MPAPNNNSKRKTLKGSIKQDGDDYDQTYGGNKVAPGMETSFYIRFSPEAKIDYSYDLVVVTERE